MATELSVLPYVVQFRDRRANAPRTSDWNFLAPQHYDTQDGARIARTVFFAACVAADKVGEVRISRGPRSALFASPNTPSTPPTS